jgi:PAS domain S-box-containing protein
MSTNPSGIGDTARLRETEAKLEVALKAARMGTWEIDFTTNALTTSELCRKDYGWPPTEPMTYEDLLGLIHPADRERRVHEITKALSAREDLEVEYRVIRPDGETVWILVRGRSEFAEDGTPTHATGVSIEITDRKRAEERQRVLVSELNHRVKNTLANVQSLVLQTRLTTEDTAGFHLALDTRIRALAKAHDLLTENSWEGAMLKEVIARTLEPYMPKQAGTNQESARRIALSGPPIRMDAEAAVVLNMAFHELVTNAAKYGALSAPAGAITVTWTVDRASRPEVIEVVWTERDGPEVRSPVRRGYGSRVLESGLAHELGGEVKMEFQPEGFVCRMRYNASSRIYPVT